ncbi:probable extracellular repeat, HAF family [Singulisphaera sp. GP187]|uniref:hypothetical protein n=1 Tax=Singulisphaera sp. GP187 TaxID=1882752 RepID=UPI000929A46B|nr:hypothetical protein [Singulisphaera sp. GP187]SIO65629.1 probable extracellular repeat, HAF family [Singulisphaera sp. GP187]
MNQRSTQQFLPSGVLYSGRRGGALGLVIAAMAISAICPSNAALAQLPTAYTVEPLARLEFDPPVGIVITMGQSINSSGQVAGYCQDVNSQLYATLWTSPASPNLQSSLLGTRTNSVLWGINDSGETTGFTDSVDGIRAAKWSAGSPINLGSPSPAPSQSHGLGINNSGHVVGYSFTLYVPPQPGFLWTPGSGFVNLGVLPAPYNGGGVLTPKAINNTGKVVGTGGNGPNAAFIWSPSTPNGTTGTLQNIASLTALGLNSFAVDINDNDQVIGNSSTYSAYLWSPTGGTIDLSMVPGGTGVGVARAINNNGVVVGDNNDPDGGNATRWDEVNGWVDLNTLVVNGTGWRLNRAWDINDNGQIVGDGVFNSQWYGFRLTPTSVPLSMRSNAVDTKVHARSKNGLNNITRRRALGGKTPIKK